MQFSAIALVASGCGGVHVNSIAPTHAVIDHAVCSQPGSVSDGRVRTNGNLVISVTNRLHNGCAVVSVQRIGSSVTLRSVMLPPGGTAVIGIDASDFDMEGASVGAVIGGAACLTIFKCSDNWVTSALIGTVTGAVLGGQELNSSPQALVRIEVMNDQGEVLTSYTFQEGISPLWHNTRSVVVSQEYYAGEPSSPQIQVY